MCGRLRVRVRVRLRVRVRVRERGRGGLRERLRERLLAALSFLSFSAFSSSKFATVSSYSLRPFGTIRLSGTNSVNPKS